MSRKKAGAKDLALFCRQMNMICRSDMTLIEGVSLLAEQTAAPRLKEALLGIHKKMEKGAAFGKAFAAQGGAFPDYLINMVALGEKSGNIEAIFAQCAAYYEKEGRFLAKLRAAAFYPAILFILMLGIIILLIAEVLPGFEALLLSLGGALPPLTKGLLAFGAFLSRYFFFIAATLLLIILGLWAYFRSPGGKKRWSRISLGLPGFGYLNRALITARFAGSMAMLIKSGASLLLSLKVAAELTGNELVTQKLQDSREDIQNQGMSLAAALENTEIFPPLFLRMVVIGERTGNLDTMLEKAAEIFEEEREDTLNRLSAALEPALIILLSAIVAVILLSVMLPMIRIIFSLG